MRENSLSNVVMGDFPHNEIKMSMEQLFLGGFTEGFRYITRGLDGFKRDKIFFYPVLNCKMMNINVLGIFRRLALLCDIVSTFVIDINNRGRKLG